MTSKVLEQVRKFFNEEWEKASEQQHKNFKGHFEGVLKYAKMLGEKENADMEVIEISVLLHDISSVRGEYEDHHLKGARIAEELLSKLNYPRNKIEQVKHCILAHRGSKDIKRETKEAQILTDADAMCHFDEIDALFNAYKIKEEVLKKLERSYVKMSKEAKSIIKPKLNKARKELT